MPFYPRSTYVLSQSLGCLCIEFKTSKRHVNLLLEFIKISKDLKAKSQAGRNSLGFKNMYCRV